MENPKKRIYTPEQKEARRIWQNERRRITDHADYKKYYPKLKVLRQKKARDAKLTKPVKENKSLPVLKKPKTQKAKKTKTPKIFKTEKIKNFKTKEKKFETLKRDLSVMKQVFIKEMNMIVYAKPGQKEEDVREKYLKGKGSY